MLVISLLSSVGEQQIIRGMIETDPRLPDSKIRKFYNTIIQTGLDGVVEREIDFDRRQVQLIDVSSRKPIDELTIEEVLAMHVSYELLRDFPIISVCVRLMFTFSEMLEVEKAMEIERK